MCVAPQARARAATALPLQWRRPQRVLTYRGLAAARDATQERDTPLHRAAMRASSDCASRLMKRGADVGARNKVRALG